MTLYIHGWVPSRNRSTLEKGCELQNIKIVDNINKSDFIYSAIEYIDVTQYPTKSFLMGPNFSVFPETKANNLSNKYKNIIYLQSCQWAADVWTQDCRYNTVPVAVYQWGVDTDKYLPTVSLKQKIPILYTKDRNDDDVQFMLKQLKEKNILYENY